MIFSFFNYSWYLLCSTKNVVFLTKKFCAKNTNLIIDRTTQILKGITKEGHKIIYGGLIENESSHFVFVDAIKLFFMIIDLWLYTEGTCNGHVLIIDMKNISLGHVARLNPVTLKKFFYYLQEGLPVRLKGYHLINVSPVTDIIFNMMKPFMKKQLLDVVRSKLHTNQFQINGSLRLLIMRKREDQISISFDSFDFY